MKHNQNVMPQGRRFECNTGMQNSVEVGPWVKVGILVSGQVVNISYDEYDYAAELYGVEASPTETQYVGLIPLPEQGDSGPITSYL